MSQYTVNDSRWQEWADATLAMPKVGMSNKVIDQMAGVFLMEGQTKPNENFYTEATCQDETIPGLIRIGVSHGLRIGLRANTSVAYMVAVLSMGRPGMAVMYTHLFKRIQQKSGIVILSTKEICMGPFADGFLTEEALGRAWDAQKQIPGRHPMGNFLDAIFEPRVPA